jgi:hypothetical protein
MATTESDIADFEVALVCERALIGSVKIRQLEQLGFGGYAPVHPFPD